MTDQELYRCESHERRITSLEQLVHIQDTATALLSSEVKNLSKNVEGLTISMKEWKKSLDEIIPQVKISKQWEDIYRAGMYLIIGAASTGIIAMLFDYFKHGR